MLVTLLVSSYALNILLCCQICTACVGNPASILICPKYFIVLSKEALKLLHGVQFSYIEGTNNNRGGNVQPIFHVESDFGVGFIIKSREIGFFQYEIGP